MFLKLLFSVNCQATVAYRAICNLHFHHLWVRHTVNYIIPPRMWVCHTVRNVGPQHLGFSFLVGPPPFLCKRSFQSYQNSTTLRDDVSEVIRVTKNLEGTMLPVNYWSWQRSFSELPKTCQQWELTFLLTVAFWATKMPTTFRAEFPVAFRATLEL